MTNLEKWTTLNSQLIIHNQWCCVRQDTVSLPNGQVIDDYFVNVRPDIAVVLPITQAQEVIFVRQYRHGVQKILLELPAGAFNPEEEDSISAAARELEEETGYVAKTLIPLATLYDNPVKDTNQIHVFLAKDVTRESQQNLDLTEDIEVVLIPLQEIQSKIKTGEISVSGTIATLYLGLNLLAHPY